MICKHSFIEDSGFSICRECGLLEGVILESRETTRSHPWGEPLGNKIYTHSVRFKKLLNRLLMFSNPPPDKIYRYLDACDVKDIYDIQHALKKSTFKSKYYEYVSFFAYTYLNHRWSALSEESVKELICCVDEISLWARQSGNNHFPFPYFFAMHKLLEHIPEIVIMVNKLKCKRRIKRYELLWKRLVKECPRLKLRKLKNIT